MKCKNCGASVNSCQNVMCINRLHDSNSFKEGESIFCENGNHYCEKDCLIEEFRELGIKGVSTIIVKNNEERPKKT